MPRRRRSTHPLYPEPGAWVVDNEGGMPMINPPGPLPKGLLDNSTIRDCAEYEGLGMCIMEYIPANRIKSTQLRLLWKSAKQAMIAVRDELDKREPRKQAKGLQTTKVQRGI